MSIKKPVDERHHGVYPALTYNVTQADPSKRNAQQLVSLAL